MTDGVAAGTPPSDAPQAATPRALDFRAVFDASPRPLLLMAADPPRFTMLAVNAAHAWAFRTTPQALLGHGVLEVFGQDLSPQIAEFVDAVRTSLEAVIATRKPHQMAVRPYALQGADGEPDERYWSAINSPVLGPDGTVTHIVSAVNDVTGEVLERRSEAARALLMREVDHRARNALTVVQSFVRLTTAETLEEFRRVLDGRVEALARAQTSLAARRWEGASLRDVVVGELAALAEVGRYEVCGEQVLLPAQHVQAMSMALHELATNAAKYGAFSTAEGRLTVTWRAEGEVLRLRWEEEAGRPVRPPTHEGFGTRLVDQLARQLEGEVRYDWRPHGLAVELTGRLA